MKPVSSNRPRWIMHVDMDAFFASVEQLDHPEYRHKLIFPFPAAGPTHE